MVKFKIKVLSPLATTVLLVSGCSSTPEYDQTEVIIWEKCMDSYLRESNFNIGLTTRQTFTYAVTACSDILPAKR
jgi:hypothetical protein